MPRIKCNAHIEHTNHAFLDKLLLSSSYHIQRIKYNVYIYFTTKVEVKKIIAPTSEKRLATTDLKLIKYRS